MSSLENRIVLITGASSGIGLAAARMFAEEGATVVLAARNQERLSEVEKEFKSKGYRFLVKQCDVRKSKEVDSLVQGAVSQFGKIDILVNNAGTALYGLVEETPDEALQDNLEVNLLGTLRCTRAVIPGMRKQQWGRIINIGSVVGKRGWAFHGAYAASKFALTGLTQSLQAELANSGITATLVMPASTKTNFFSSATIVSDSYQQTMVGPVQSAEVVAKYIIKSAKQPKENVYTIWWMKWSFILAEMFPWLYSTASKQFFRRKNKQNQVK